TGSGILLNGTGSGVTLLGNRIGTDFSGQFAKPNNVGITIRHATATVTIGSTAAAGRNVISGNTADGVDVLSGKAFISGNYIGIAQDGTTSLGNKEGILLASDGNTVGAGNVVSGNGTDGIEITGKNNLVTNSFIGTDKTGNAKVTNGSNN